MLPKLADRSLLLYHYSFFLSSLLQAGCLRLAWLVFLIFRGWLFLIFPLTRLAVPSNLRVPNSDLIFPSTIYQIYYFFIIFFFLRNALGGPLYVFKMICILRSHYGKGGSVERQNRKSVISLVLLSLLRS